MKKLFLLIAICLFCACLAQEIATGAITVNGLRIGGRYTMRQMTDALGATAQLKTPDKSDELENAYELRYGKDSFSYIDGEFCGFTLWSSNYAVNGSIRIGDSAAKLDCPAGAKTSGKSSDGTLWIEWTPSGPDANADTTVTFYFDLSGKLSCIRAHTYLL